MKILISEINIKQKNPITTTDKGQSSIAYKLISPKANSWIKKPKEKERYNDFELKQFKIQQENPHVFAKTKIINNRLIKTENIVTFDKWNDYEKYAVLINTAIDNLNLDFSFGFWNFVDDIYMDGFNNIDFNKLINYFIKNNQNNIALFLKKIKSTFRAFRKVLIKYGMSTKQRYDTHKGNIGFDLNGNIKILDW